MRSRVLAIIGVATLGLVACGGSTSTTRNAEGDMLSCVSQSDSKITTDGQLELHFCAGATEWIRQDAAGGQTEKMPVVDGIATTSLSSFISMKVHSFDAQGNKLGIDKIYLNGSRGGMTYSVDLNQSSPVFYEVALRGWSGSDADPITSWSKANATVTTFNNSSAPAGDWFVPSRSEIVALFDQAEKSHAADLQLPDTGEGYWLTDTLGRSGNRPDGQKGIRYYMVGRSTISPKGSYYWYRADTESTLEYVRPVRSYTAGDGPAILVNAGLAAPTDETPTSVDPETNSPNITLSTIDESSLIPPTTTETEQVTRIRIIRLDTPQIQLAEEVTTISVTPEDVKKNITDVAPEAVKKAEISFDGGDWIAISLNATTDIAVPADAKSAVLQVTTESGQTLQVEKTITRGGSDVSTTTDAPMHEPTKAAPIAGDDSKSSNTAMFGGIGIALLVVLVAAGAMQTRRRKKNA